MQIWAAFVSTLLPQVVAAADAAPSRQPAAATLAHAGSGLASQLVLHALGESVSQGYVWVAVQELCTG